MENQTRIITSGECKLIIFSTTVKNLRNRIISVQALALYLSGEKSCFRSTTDAIARRGVLSRRCYGSVEMVRKRWKSERVLGKSLVPSRKVFTYMRNTYANRYDKVSECFAIIPVTRRVKPIMLFSLYLAVYLYWFAYHTRWSCTDFVLYSCHCTTLEYIQLIYL